jgi:hypothetical protein
MHVVIKCITSAPVSVERRRTLLAFPSDPNPGVFWSHLGRWRDGEIKSKGGSSDESPRYLVSR